MFMKRAGRLLLILRHGPAETIGPAGDASRRLSPAGRERMRLAASALAEFVPKPAQIWSSPLIRAHETAELLAAAFAIAEVVQTPLLAPGFERERLVAELEQAVGGCHVIVGHEPDVSGLTAWLIGARGELEFGSGTAALVSFTSPGQGALHALYPLETFNSTD